MLYLQLSKTKLAGWFYFSSVLELLILTGDICNGRGWGRVTHDSWLLHASSILHPIAMNGAPGEMPDSE